MARITIIETGQVPQKYRERHGSFPDMFERMVRAEDPTASVDVVSIPNGDALPDPGKLEAVLITGAAAGVYDGLDWIAPLEDFVRQAYASKTPMVGVCFGHQLIAQALGGTVRKSEKGWGIGRHVYQVLPENGVVGGEAVAIAASHQDQVIVQPPNTTIVAESAFTPYAALAWTDRPAISFQFHPEFSPAFARALIEKRYDIVPDPDAAIASLDAPNDNARVGGWIRRFLEA